MKHSPVFNLIKSLTGAEKRYFKLHAKLHVKGEENAYVKLFDLIESQNVYNEESLRQSLKEGTFKTNFSQAKAALYNLLLKVLRNYHSQNFSQLEQNDQHSNFEILFARGLYYDAERILEKARHNPLYSESAAEEFRINTLSYRNTIRSNQTEQLLHWKNNYFRTQNRLIEEMQKELVVQECFLNIYSILRISGIQYTKEGKGQLDAFIKPLKKIRPVSVTRSETLYWYWMCLLFYHYLRADIKKSISASEHVLHLFEKREKKDIAVLDNISIIIGNLFHMEVGSGNKERAIQLYHRLTELWDNYPVLNSEAKFYRMLSSLMGLYIKDGDLEEAIQLFESNAAKINLNTYDQHALISLLLNVVWLYIYNGQNAKTNRYLRFLVDQVYTHSSSDYLLAARIASIVILMDEGNYRVAAHMARSSERLFTKFKKMDPSLKLIIHFFKNYSKEATTRKESDIFKALREDILRLKNHKTMLIYQFTQLQLWIEHKITGKPISSLLSAKALSKTW